MHGVLIIGLPVRYLVGVVLWILGINSTEWLWTKLGLRGGEQGSKRAVYVRSLRFMILLLICGVGVVKRGQVKRGGPWKRFCPDPAEMRTVDETGSWQLLEGRDRTGQQEPAFSYLKIKGVFSILKIKKDQ